ncbi:MAG: ROK family protein, partial [Alistipes sp.]|nr:ROK family protein [Alistipes sp.]
MRNNTPNNAIVVTLDAGGTNFVFGAMRNYEAIGETITLPSSAHDLDKCLNTLIEGFSQIIATLPEKPVAISFAFPGPADYRNGIIGGYLPNFPSFRDGVALGPMLEEKFGIPVFINNDADLFAYGEAAGGALPRINQKLEAMGVAKRCHNLLGYTFGTGFGFGFVMDGKLNLGDNSCVETFCLKHRDTPQYIVEDGVSIRAIKRVYRELSGDDRALEPYDIYRIAEGEIEGNSEAAKESFATLGRVAGDAMATAATLMDGIIVIGGGLTGASKY